MYICSEQLNYCAATLTELKTKCTETITIRQSLRGYVFMLRLLDNNSMHVIVFYRHLELHPVMRKKALKLMLTVVNTHMLNVCVCKSNKAADKMYLSAHIKDYSCTKLKMMPCRNWK